MPPVFKPRRFANMIVGIGVAVLVTEFAVAYFTVDLPGAGLLFIPFFIAAMNEGQKYAKLQG